MNIKIQGGQRLSGEITPSGYKNAVVALIPASILFDSLVVFENVPDITDVARLVKIMEKLGSRVEWDKQAQVLKLDNKNLRFDDLDREDLGNMKGTSLLWGPMLARFGKVTFKQLPGGCTLGNRPLGAHYDAFEELGVTIKEDTQSAEMDASNLHASEIWLREMSPTATENVVMLATAIQGKTKIVGAASEPQVQDLCNFLNECGAKINGIGSSVLEIEGGVSLSAKPHRVISDYYEIATFISLAAATGGELKVHDALPEHFRYLKYIFSKFGVEIRYDGTTAVIDAEQDLNIDTSDGKGALIVRAQPWPSLPVDTMPLFIPLALAAKSGQVLFHNWMYEAGLFWTSELQKLGANIIMCDPHRVIVTAGNKLHGATLEAPYIIRAVVAMVMASMIAQGESTILNADALYRGHPKFSENLKNLGATISELS